VDDRVGRFRGDDAGLGDADVVIVAAALLGVGDGGALHRALHRAGAAAGADVDVAQAELVADRLGVVVLPARDRVAAPAHDQVGFDVGAQNAGVAQDLEHGIGDAVGAFEVEAGRAAAFVGDDLGGHVGDVA